MSLIQRIKEDSATAGLLIYPFDFDLVATALGLDLTADVMARLLAAARRTAQDFVLVHSEGHELEPLVPAGTEIPSAPEEESRPPP